jgi:choline dehydrogenase-like flavoprotein
VSAPWAYREGAVQIGQPRDRDLDPELPVIDAADIESDLILKTKALVIGSGAGGAVVARALAAAGIETVILEKGARFQRKDFHRAPLYGLLEMYEGGGLTATVGRPPMAMPWGRAVGGTTIVNSGTCFRVPERVLEHWSKTGLHMLAGGALVPYYERVEARINVGPVTDDVAGTNAHVVKRGAEKLGLSGGYLSRNAKGCVGSGRCVLGCPSGAKQSMERSYLPEAVAAGAKIYARCAVERVLIEGGRAAGVVARFSSKDGGHGRQLIACADHVVIAAGAIGTPMLMLRNGLGGPHVGRHLHVHPAAKVYALMEEIVAGPGVPQAYYVDELHDRGVMLEGAYLPPELSTTGLPFFGKRHSDLMNEADRLAMFGIMVTDTSEGRVRLGLGDGPLIRYDLNKTDTHAFKLGIALAAKLFFAAGARRVMPGLVSYDVLESERDVARLEKDEVRASELELVAFHPMGSCRLGVDREKSVVSPDLEVYGVRGLSIADGSVIPSSIGVNPQLTIMALAERGAESLAVRLKS